MFGNGSEGINQLQKRFSENLIVQSSFFLKYLLTCTFISNCVVIMDIPHQISKRVWAKLYKFDKEFEGFKKEKDL